MPPEIEFQPLDQSHLIVLHGWLQQPHVREFWDDGDRAMEQVRAHYFADDMEDTEPYIFTLDGRPAGYIQAYPVPPDADFAAWRAGAGDTWGIDLYIGEPGLLGRGHGAPIIGVHPPAARPTSRPPARPD